jgi:hypothetical protein
MATRESETQTRPGTPHPRVFLGLAAVILASLGLHLWGITGDLPYPPDVDEPIFLQAALHVVHHMSLNPGWFGHPGSTTIYPIAGLIELWYLAAKYLPPFAHAMPPISTQFVADPTPFYLIGRFVSAAYGVASVIATWLIARRIVGDAGGVLATLILPATPILVLHGQIVRTDTAGLFFALVALWLILRATERGRSRDWGFAAIAIGLAISSRYFFAMLVAPYGVAAWLSLRSSLQGRNIQGWLRACRAPGLALFLVPVAFFATSPFVVLDFDNAVTGILAEAGGVHPGADGLSPLGNLAWYVGDVIPTVVSPGILILALVGAVLIARRHRRPAAILGAFAVVYLLAVSASPLHWDRYVFPLLPLIGIAATATVQAIGGALASALGRRRSLMRALAAGILVVLLVPSFLTVAAADRLRAVHSTHAVATDWVLANLPPGSGVAEEMRTAYLSGIRPDVLRVFSLADRSLDDYRAGGYRYLLWSSAMADRYRDASRYPKESAFYASLEATQRLLISFEPGPDRSGAVIRIYQIGPD